MSTRQAAGRTSSARPPVGLTRPRQQPAPGLPVAALR
jgi:hypothetical protein